MRHGPKSAIVGRNARIRQCRRNQPGNDRETMRQLLVDQRRIRSLDFNEPRNPAAIG